jgi:hypothetical protein
MSDAAEMIERHDRVLAELTQLGLMVTRALAARAPQVETLEEQAVLAMAFQRVSRSVRQTLALEDRLRRLREADARAAIVTAEQKTKAVRKQRHDQVRACVARLIWTEAEGSEGDHLCDALDELLDEDLLYDDFADETLEAHIARVCAVLGVANPFPTETETSPADCTAPADTS